MSDYSTAQEIIETWFKKGELENNDFTKFICFYISFNCWLFTYTQEIRDQKALNKLKIILNKNHNLSNKYRILVENNKSILIRVLNLGPVKNNRISERQSQLSDIYNISQLVNVVYEIRCNLFHGTKIDSDYRDKEIIRSITPVLKLLITFLRNSLIF